MSLLLLLLLLQGGGGGGVYHVLHAALCCDLVTFYRSRSISSRDSTKEVCNFPVT